MKTYGILQMLFIFLVSIPLPAICVAQSNPEEIEQCLKDYVKLSKKKKFEEASEKLSRAQRRAVHYTSTDINYETKALLSYLLTLDLKKQGKTGTSYYHRLVDVTTYGTKPDQKPSGYAVGLATADAYLQEAKRVRIEYKAHRYICAILTVNNLQNSGLPIDISLRWKDVFTTAGYFVSSGAAEEIRNEAADSLAAMPGWMFFRNACTAVDDNDTRARDIVATFCISKARELGIADTDALEGFAYQHGKLGKKDEAKADSLYAEACRKGSVWGAMQHAWRLCGKGRYQEALKIVDGHREDPKFGNEGGNFLMGYIIDHGGVKDSGATEALRYYVANNEKCRWPSWKKEAQGRIAVLERETLDEEISRMKKENGDFDKWNARLLASAAERYERIKDTETSSGFRKMAALKGHARSANIYAVTAYNNRRNGKFDMAEAADILKLSVDEEYPPTLYNLTLLYNYGVGVEKDEEKALHYKALYDQIKDDYETSDFSKSEFLPSSLR